MEKKILAHVKLQLEAGLANPAPPVGPALGAHGVNIMAFCKEYNLKTSEMKGSVVPVEITIYSDKSFDLTLLTPPASMLIKKALGVTKGSSRPNMEKIGTLTREKIEEIVKIKFKGLNTDNKEKAFRIIEGSARSMGVIIV